MKEKKIIWRQVRLGEILGYTQPTPYIVQSTEYTDAGVPVLTAGKTFLLGYTDETMGVYNNLPTILFDDFTTASRFVDFPFKVKSSAAKMLNLKYPQLYDIYYVFAAMQVIDYQVGDHQRHWISIYSNLTIPIPFDEEGAVDMEEQRRIAGILSDMDEEIRVKETLLAKHRALKQGVMQQLLAPDTMAHLASDTGAHLTSGTAAHLAPDIAGEATASTHTQRRRELVRLGDIGIICMCKRILKHQTDTQGEVPFYKIGTFGGEPDAYISKELFEEYKCKYNYPRKGDVLISAAGTIGRVVSFDGKPAYFQDSNIVWLQHDETIVLNDYLYYYYTQVKWDVSNGGTVPRLYNDSLLAANISIPCKEDGSPDLVEQRRIAGILSDMDAEIGVQEEVIEKLKAVKQGVMQGLLNAQQRA